MSAAMIPLALMAGGTAISAVGQFQAADAASAAGKAQQQAADYQAVQARQQAGQVRASAQRSAIDQRRQADLVASRARAVAAASGGGVSDPTVVNILGKIGAEGDYRSLSALYTGEERARGLETGADLSTFEGSELAAAGQARASAMRTQALGSLIAGGGSMFAKYGGTTPSTPTALTPTFTAAQNRAYSDGLFYG